MTWTKAKTIWTKLNYPVGSEKHEVLSSPDVSIDGIGHVKIGYEWLYRGGANYGLSTSSIYPGCLSHSTTQMDLEMLHISDSVASRRSRGRSHSC